MFAFVVPGRLVQQTIQDPSSPKRFLAQIDQVFELNHITVFLSGQAPFPEGYGATVHLEIPGKGFQLIGGLSNDKPSAIFRLRGTTIPSVSTTQFTSTGGNPNVATLGILCEPLASIATQLSNLPPSSSSSTALVPSSSSSSSSSGAGVGTIGGEQAVKLAQLIGKNLFNAVAGFVKPLPGTEGGGEGWIEFGQVENWYRNFERKLRTMGVGFLTQSD
ncbi:Opi10p [Sporobolomyces salmoneus]|uniref:Opi10p n=1 Tax=Sporobolomyces salmoneus TaxID=183962 RepID=UPI003173C242